jgi:glycosyltransferase involved in cell wall biosynthesis
MNDYVSIVVPTLNEEKNIAKVIHGIRKNLRSDRYEILVVDGHSRDNTVRIAKSLGARVIYDSEGKGSALIKGFNAAKGSIIVSMDADLSNEPKELNLLVESIRIGYDVCMGSRFMVGGGSEDISGIRVIGNKFFVFIVNLIFRSHYSDMCYGYRSFRKSIIRKLRLKEKGFGIETEININAVKARLKVIEIPSTEKKREAGEAKLRTFRDGYIILKTILKNSV